MANEQNNQKPLELEEINQILEGTSQIPSYIKVQIEKIEQQKSQKNISDEHTWMM